MGTGGQPTPRWQLEQNARRGRAARRHDCPDCGSPILVGPDADHDDLPEPVSVDDVRLTRLGMYQALTAGTPVLTVSPGRYGLEVNRLGYWARPDPDRDRVTAMHTCGVTHEHTPTPPRDRHDGPPPF